MRDRGFLALIVLLLLLFWGTRLYGIETFPPFMDETIHIHGTEIILENGHILEGINLGRQFTIWWYTLFRPAESSPLWVARVATGLAFLPGVASALALARLAGGRWAALFTGLLLLFSAYHQFFGRLALADGVSGGAVLLAIYFAYRLRYRASSRDALLVGVLLFLAAGAKINTLPYFGVPVAAVLALYPAGRKWRKQLRWFVVALGTGVGLLGAFVIALRLRGLDFLSNSLSLAANGRGDLDLSTVFNPSRIIGNAQDALEALATYLGTLALVLLLGSLPLLLLSRRLRSTGTYLLLCLLGPALALWINQPQEMRFYIVPVALLLLSGGIAVSWLTQQQGQLVRFAAMALILIWGIVLWLPFTRQSASEPALLPLPARDYAQYVASDASGFGMKEVYETLREREVTELIGLLANCQGLRYSLPSDYLINCPPLRPDGQDIEAATDLMESSRRENVYAVLEDISYAPDSAPGVQVAVIEHPSGRPRLTIYDLAPDP